MLANSVGPEGMNLLTRFWSWCLASSLSLYATLRRWSRFFILSLVLLISSFSCKFFFISALISNLTVSSSRFVCISFCFSSGTLCKIWKRQRMNWRNQYYIQRLSTPSTRYDSIEAVMGILSGIIENAQWKTTSFWWLDLDPNINIKDLF